MLTQVIDRRHLLRTAAALAAGATALGAPAVLRAAEGRQKINWGYLPANVQLAPYVGKENPWLEEGLDLQLMRTPGGPAILQMMVSGDLQVGEAATAPAIVAACKRLPIYFLLMAGVATPKHPLDRIMVLPDSPIKKFQDLQGRTLAINQFGTMPDAILGSCEKVFGIKKSAINIVPVPYPNMPQLLAQKQVDAIYPFPPVDSVAEVNSNARTITETSDLVPYVGYTMVGVRREFADANPDAIRRLIRGTVKMQRWISGHEKEARDVSNQALGISGAIGEKTRMPYFLANGLTVMPNMWHIYYLLAAGKVIDPVDDPAKMFDEYFVKPLERFTLPALHEIGMEPDPVAKQMLSANYPMLPKPPQEYWASWERS